MVTPEAVGLSTQRLARIRPAVERHLGDDRIAGAVTLVARRGEVVHLDCAGFLDRESRTPMQTDTIFRLYSMTKPIACVALMTLFEQGYFQLFDPVSKFIPGFADLKVYAGGSGADVQLVDLERPVTVRDLLTHTSGLTYHIYEYSPVEQMYRDTRLWSPKPLSELIDDLLKLPLAFQPGTRWRYSVAHDVVAYLVEVLSGQSFDIFLQENLFEPLGMVDAGFYVPEHKLDRFASMYGSSDFDEVDQTMTRWFGDAEAGVNRRLAGPRDSLQSRKHNVLRGGVGLVATASDYWRFCQMLLNGGELNGTRVLGRKTVELISANYLAPGLLPFEADNIYYPGLGYGLGFSVILTPAQADDVGSAGTYGWSGAATTNFWIDPVEELIGLQMSQYQPNGYHLIGPDFRVAVYQSIVD